ncbi:Transcription factor [Porphyridium purpureum]|uniref:Transcription factor n=1 Tax=Porphyridium purpureum TaxID=35688 RepID=A0A5J4YVW8_PORPP|nr:Transcription factor [Porphyridium purpureum]|eukprot:POR3482..scf227_4
MPNISAWENTYKTVVRDTMNRKTPSHSHEKQEREQWMPVSGDMSTMVTSASRVPEAEPPASRALQRPRSGVRETAPTSTVTQAHQLERPTHRSPSDSLLFSSLSQRFANFGTIMARTLPLHLIEQRRNNRTPLSRLVREAGVDMHGHFLPASESPSFAPLLPHTGEWPVRTMPALGSARRTSSSSSEDNGQNMHICASAIQGPPSRHSEEPRCIFFAEVDTNTVSTPSAPNTAAGHEQVAVSLPGDGRRRWQAWEDDIVRDMVGKQGPQLWNKIAERLPHRTANQIRLRWRQSLDPDLRKSAFTEDEDKQLLHLQGLFGNKWKVIASQIGGNHCFNDVKNRWHNLQKKKIRRLDLPTSVEERNSDEDSSSPERVEPITAAYCDAQMPHLMTVSNKVHLARDPSLGQAKTKHGKAKAVRTVHDQGARGEEQNFST